MTKWIVTMTVVIDNEEPLDKGVETAQDALFHAKNMVAFPNTSTRNRVQLDIDESISKRNRYSGTLESWSKLTSLPKPLQ